MLGVELALACALGASCGGPSEVPESGLIEDAASRVLTARVRFVPRRGRPADACRTIGAGDLTARIRGVPVDEALGLRVERTRRPTAWAFLIDTSGSIVDDLDAARRVAVERIRSLREGVDRVMVATFADDPVLVRGFTYDLDAATRAVEGIRAGGFTAVTDGMYVVLREVVAVPERPVVVVITDGVDNASWRGHRAVRDLARLRPDLAVFVVGFRLPAVGTLGPSGAIASRRLMHRLGQASDGAFRAVYGAKEFANALARFAEGLANEAIVTAPDPEPTRAVGKLELRSIDPGCRVRVLDRGRASGRHVHDVDLREALTASKISRRRALVVDLDRDARCPTPGKDRRESVRDLGDRLRFCVADIALDDGLLYDTVDTNRMRTNDWLARRVRPWEIPLPDPDDVPVSPVGWLDRLGDDIPTDARDRPSDPLDRVPARHARPYHDLPLVGHGDTALAVRRALAREIGDREAYREHARGRLSRDVARALAELRDRMHRIAPDAPAERVARAVRDSPDGRALLAREGAGPNDADLERYLTAWHGDVAAADLMTAWEAREIDRLLAEGPDPDRDAAFRRRYVAVYGMLRSSSHARVLALLAPVVDPETDDIGFWRIVLPRPAWTRERVRRRLDDLERPPFDLVAPEPAAFEAVHARLLRDTSRPRSGRDVSGVLEVRYFPEGKRRRRTPERAFENARIEVEFRDGSRWRFHIRRGDPARKPSKRDRAAEVRTVRPQRERRLRLTTRPGAPYS